MKHEAAFFSKQIPGPYHTTSYTYFPFFFSLKLLRKIFCIFQVAWLRVDTQTILTIHSHVITKNHRIAVTHTEHRNWYLHIRDIRETDMGWYMCQINTDPMKSQVGFLNVVGKKSLIILIKIFFVTKLHIWL